MPHRVATDKPEIQKLAGFWNRKQPVPWVRIHKLPEYVHFPHMRHVNAGVSCQTCHGDVQKMAEGLSAEQSQHGLVRQLPRRSFKSPTQGAVRLRDLPLLACPSILFFTQAS